LVNDTFSTNIYGVYAIGDVISGSVLAQKADDEDEVDTLLTRLRNLELKLEKLIHEAAIVIC
jgi:hypothetical protein